MSAVTRHLRALMLCALLACSVSVLTAATASAQGAAGTWGYGWADDDPGSADDVNWLPGLPETPAAPQPPAPGTQTVSPGTYTLLRADGKAAVPNNAPARVRAIVRAANRIVGRPYKWGGGHARLADRGYDCSGTVGYALIGGGLLNGPLVAAQFKRFGAAGPGRWVTIYASQGHVYMEVAGLRLDTSTVGDPSTGSGPRWRLPIGQRAGFKVRHPVGL
jgi:hypothetical protein